MPYEIKQSPKEMLIEECEWAMAPMIRFGRMTSCIGIVGKVPGDVPKVIGLHLVEYSSGGEYSFDRDKDVILTTLQHCEQGSVVVLGWLDGWPDLQKLLAALSDRFGPVRTNQLQAYASYVVRLTPDRRALLIERVDEQLVAINPTPWQRPAAVQPPTNPLAAALDYPHV